MSLDVNCIGEDPKIRRKIKRRMAFFWREVSLSTSRSSAKKPELTAKYIPTVHIVSIRPSNGYIFLREEIQLVRGDESPLRFVDQTSDSIALTDGKNRYYRIHYAGNPISQCSQGKRDLNLYK